MPPGHTTPEVISVARQQMPDPGPMEAPGNTLPPIPDDPRREMPERKTKRPEPGFTGPFMGTVLERPISPAYPEIDTDLARDNLENDIPAADLEDL